MEPIVPGQLGYFLRQSPQDTAPLDGVLSGAFGLGGQVSALLACHSDFIMVRRDCGVPYFGGIAVLGEFVKGEALSVFLFVTCLGT
jgi:hypothetical protein